MKIIEKKFETYIVEKKSKFIANIIYVDNIKKAEDELKRIRKLYYDAKHHCFAYRIINEDNIVEKASDDGEPSGTAGMPMLDILRGKEICNAIVIVTRYFGGILLGTGGLVKAYSDVTKKVIEDIELYDMVLGYEVEVILEYKNFDVFRHYCKISNINVLNIEYGQNIKLTIELDKEKCTQICNNNEYNKLKILKSRILSNKLIRKIY